MSLVLVSTGKNPYDVHASEVYSDLAMRCLNTDKLLTNKVTTIYKMQKILQLKDIYNLEAGWPKKMCTHENFNCDFD